MEVITDRDVVVSERINEGSSKIDPKLITFLKETRIKNGFTSLKEEVVNPIDTTSMVVDTLKLVKNELDKKVAALQTTIETCDSIVETLQEFRDKLNSFDFQSLHSALDLIKEKAGTLIDMEDTEIYSTDGSETEKDSFVRFSDS